MVGDTRPRWFVGKIIAATNRSLAIEMQERRFRQDLFFRICADQIRTPSLAEQLADRPEDLVELVKFVAEDILEGQASWTSPEAAPSEFRGESERLSKEVIDWIDRNLGRDYAWPGNFRELGQCVRNVMIRGRYHPEVPRGARHASGALEELLDQVRKVELSADELCARYYALAYHQFGNNYRAAARHLGKDWRVIRDGLDRLFHQSLEKTGTPRPRA
jgi:DNA-binding NtrC family response regulator